jgi:predicted MFS family arabinose efflux permease
MFIAAMNQLLWITFAPVTQAATVYYGVSDLSIGLLSVSFMAVYIIAAIPASWTIDTCGFRRAVGIGAVLTGVFGLLRGLVPPRYTLVLICQILIAIGQPFILNAITKVAARWFPPGERATAAGLGSLGAYLGILVGLGLTPYLADQRGMAGMLTIYGVLALLAMILFLALAREHPPTPPGPADQEIRSLAFDGLRAMLRQRDFLVLLFIFFVGLGAFNAVTTWIEEVTRPNGFSADQAGISGALMIVGGIVGAIVIPPLSDHFRRRVPFIVLALAGAALGLVVLTFATQYWLLLVATFLFGFCLLSAGPVGFQYGAEITYPAPEGTSNGLILLMGQISGIIFIFAMDGLKSPVTGAMTAPLLALVGLTVVTFVASFTLREPRPAADRVAAGKPA